MSNSEVKLQDPFEPPLAEPADNNPTVAPESNKDKVVGINSKQVRSLGKEAVGASYDPDYEADSESESLIDKADVPFSTLERLFGSDLEVKRAIYKLQKDPRRVHLFHDDDILGDYLRRAGNYSTLTKTEVEDLYVDIKLGVSTLESIDDLANISAEDRATLIKATIAHQTMMTTNLRLVVSIAKRINKFPDLLPMADLISEGNLGLFHAISKFEPDKGFKFSTYATWWIKQYITRASSEKTRMIKLPYAPNEEAYQMKISEDELRAKLKRQPTNDELIEETGLTDEKIALYKLRGGYYIKSLDELVDSGKNTTLRDLVGPDPEKVGEEEQFIVSMYDKDEVDRILNDPKLGWSNQDRLFISMWFGLTLEPFEGQVFEKSRGRKISIEEIQRLRPQSGVFTQRLMCQIFGHQQKWIIRTKRRLMNDLQASAATSTKGIR